MSSNRDTRLAVAESLAQELDLDMTPKFLAACDVFLIQLWMRGFKVTRLSGDEHD